jgi:threonine/homoserine/homoserine lactone efflux protein
MSFIPDQTILIQFAIASVILAITPGPDMTLFVSRTLSRRW